MTPEQVKEFKDAIASIDSKLKAAEPGLAAVKDLPATFDLKKLPEQIKALGDDNVALRSQLDQVKRHNLRLEDNLSRALRGQTKPGQVSDGMASYLAATFIIASASKGVNVKEHMLKWAQDEIVDTVAQQRRMPNSDHLEAFSKAVRGLQVGQRTALTTSDIPLPVIYSGEVFELVELYGTFRRYATTFPMPAGDARVPYLSTDPSVGFEDMSASITEASPAVTNISLSAKKAARIVRVPAEIDEDNIIMLGQFLARWGARRLASWEDSTGWLADGSSTYKLLKGVRDMVDSDEDNKLVNLASGLTATSDITAAHLRSLRGVPSSAVYEHDAAYYMHPTMEALLATFNTDDFGRPWDPQRQTFDGVPVRWINKLNAYSNTAIPSTVPVLYGAMSFWLFAPRGGVRVDLSADAAFATDELLYRFVERFTIGRTDPAAIAGIKTAAA